MVDEIRESSNQSEEREASGQKKEKERLNQKKETIETLLREIRDILCELKPKPKPWWKRRAVWTVLIGFILLFLLKFPSEAMRNADMLVPEKSEVRVVVLPQLDWSGLGLPPNPNFRNIPNELSFGINVDTLLQFNLVRQGRIYKQTGVRVQRSGNGLIADLFSRAIISGPTKIEVKAIGEPSASDAKMIRGIIKNYCIEAADKRVNLDQFVDPLSFKGYIVIETEPRMGFERFWWNLERVYGLFF